MSIQRSIYVGPYFIVIPPWGFWSAYEFVEELFGDGDTFTYPESDSDELLILPNKEGQGGVYVDEYGSQNGIPIPENRFGNGDFPKLAEALRVQGIIFEAAYGIVNFWM